MLFTILPKVKMKTIFRCNQFFIFIKFSRSSICILFKNLYTLQGFIDDEIYLALKKSSLKDSRS